MSGWFTAALWSGIHSDGLWRASGEQGGLPKYHHLFNFLKSRKVGLYAGEVLRLANMTQSALRHCVTLSKFDLEIATLATKS